MEKKNGQGRPTKDDKEKRQKRINFRLTYQEYISLVKQKPAHLDDSAFFRNILLTKEVILLDYVKLDSALNEIKRVGVNLNQIAKKVNSLGLLDTNDHHQLMEGIKDLSTRYYEIIDVINNH